MVTKGRIMKCLERLGGDRTELFWKGSWRVRGGIREEEMRKVVDDSRKRRIGGVLWEVRVSGEKGVRVRETSMRG